MPIEVEKKYRLTQEQCAAVTERLMAQGALGSATEFEVNTLYRSPTLDLEKAILRLRRVGDRAILTFKKRYSTPSPIKRQLEEETEVADADAVERILVLLGFTPSLLYEKRRQTWIYGGTEISVDELPFGWFAEIEGPEPNIETVELKLALDGLQAEEATYPELTRRHGKVVGAVIEARFAE